MIIDGADMYAVIIIFHAFANTLTVVITKYNQDHSTGEG